MPSWKSAAAFLWNLMPIPFGKMEAAVYTPRGEGEAGGEIPINKILDIRDWENPSWRAVHEELGFVYDPARLDRRQWELTQGVYGLKKLRCLCPEAVALGLGAGHERIVYYLANRLRKVVATDLYGGERDPRMLTEPEFFAPYAYPRARLEVRRMSPADIDFPDNSFDIVFAFATIGRLGSRREQLRLLTEARRVLKPGGVAVLSAGMILNRFGRDGVSFSRRELLGDLLDGSGLTLAGGDFHFSLSRDTFEGLVRLPREIHRDPRLITRRIRTTATSCVLCLQRPIPPGTEEEEWSPRGEEKPVTMPHLLNGRLKLTSAAESIRASAEFALPCRIDNTGSARWPSSSTGEVGVVRLGAHLRDGDGRMMKRDFGRADLPCDVGPGEEAFVTINLKAPETPGRYVLELDLVREGITWFAAAGANSALIFELKVE